MRSLTELQAVMGCCCGHPKAPVGQASKVAHPRGQPVCRQPHCRPAGVVNRPRSAAAPGCRLRAVRLVPWWPVAERPGRKPPTLPDAASEALSHPSGCAALVTNETEDTPIQGQRMWGLPARGRRIRASRIYSASTAVAPLPRVADGELKDQSETRSLKPEPPPQSIWTRLSPTTA